MEKLVSIMFKSYTIVRLGNINWGTNPNTILNFFRSQFLAGRIPELKDVYRHVVSKEEFLYWMRLIKSYGKNEMNIPGEFIHVSKIWERISNEYTSDRRA